MKRALVTGSAGFLGRHFAAELTRRGYEVQGLDIANGEKGDCRAAFRSLRHGPYDLVVHCAAVVGGRMKIDRSPLATAVNFALDAEMFRWASLAGVCRVLYISSSAAYPVDLQRVPLPERLREGSLMPGLGGAVQPDQVYGWSKVVGEVLAGKLREAGVQVTVVRPFSGYGADQDDTYPFPAFVARARRREDPFTVWGDGEQVRDFIHVGDLVGGALAVVDAEADGPVNLCSGVGTSFNDLARMVCTAARYAPQLKHLEDAPIGVRYRVGDPSRMLSFYEPRVPLAEGIRRALAGES